MDAKIGSPKIKLRIEIEVNIRLTKSYYRHGDICKLWKNRVDKQNCIFKKLQPKVTLKNTIQI